jgi:cold shock CspA family protein
MDAIELISKNDRITGVCIASSDGGFGSLAQRLREFGIYVMAVGNNKTPERFKRACHNFVFLDNLELPKDNLKVSSLDKLLINAYQRCADTNEPVYMGDMGTMLKVIDSSFDCRTYKYKSLKKLIKAQTNLFEIVGETDDRCFIVQKGSLVIDDLTTVRGKIRKWLDKKNSGFIETSDGDFYFKLEDINGSNKFVQQGLNVSFNVLKNELTNDSGTDNNCPRVSNVNILV